MKTYCPPATEQELLMPEILLQSSAQQANLVAEDFVENGDQIDFDY